MPKEYYGHFYGHFNGYNGENEIIDKRDIKITITQPRNIKHHNLIFGMLNYVLNHMKPREFFNSPRRLLILFKDNYGYYTPFTTSKGDVIKEYESFSFASMCEQEFKPVSEQIREFCYAVLNMDKCSKEVIQGLLDIEF